MSYFRKVSSVLDFVLYLHCSVKGGAAYNYTRKNQDCPLKDHDYNLGLRIFVFNLVKFNNQLQTSHGSSEALRL